MMRVTHIVLSLILLLLCACRQEIASVMKPTASDHTVAEVGNYAISEADVLQIVPRGYTKEDSLAWVNEYVKNWVIDHVMLQKASWSSDEQEEIDRQVEEYRQQLIIERYQKNIIRKEFHRNLSKRFFSSSSSAEKESERALVDSIPDKALREAAQQVLFMKEYRDDLYEKAIQSGTAVVK